MSPPHTTACQQQLLPDPPTNNSRQVVLLSPQHNITRQQQLLPGSSYIQQQRGHVVVVTAFLFCTTSLTYLSRILRLYEFIVFENSQLQEIMRSSRFYRFQEPTVLKDYKLQEFTIFQSLKQFLLWQHKIVALCKYAGSLDI